uniref:Putative prophage integrase n=1 Tax=blood disease bacterium R229 TaxID=741978 RepID=G2ZVW1_9RALS|nr:putative prophage integrase [blood disease bacterium R229]
MRKVATVERAANSFEAVAREWHAKYAPGWSESNAKKVLARLENDVFPWLGGRPIAELKAPELLVVCRRVESRGALDTAHRVLQTCGQIFRYAVATGRAERDPSGDLRGVLPPAKGKHYAAPTDPKEVAGLLRMFDGFTGTFVVKCALLLAPMLFVRPSELRVDRPRALPFPWRAGQGQAHVRGGHQCGAQAHGHRRAKGVHWPRRVPHCSHHPRERQQILLAWFRRAPVRPQASHQHCDRRTRPKLQHDVRGRTQIVDGDLGGVTPSMKSCSTPEL